MGRYYFHVRSESSLVEDPEGSRVPSLAAAREEAVADARELMSRAILEGVLSLDRQIEVTDSAGETVLVVPFKDAIDIRWPSSAPVDTLGTASTQDALGAFMLVAGRAGALLR